MKIKKDTMDLYKSATWIKELEEENHQNYKDMLAMDVRREQIEQAIRDFCLDIISGSLHVIEEDQVIRCETMDILELISFSKKVLNLQLQEWVDRSMELIDKINYYENKQ